MTGHVDHHHFHGKDIPHVEMSDDLTITELIDIFSNSGYNAKQLANAAKYFSDMIEKNATICLTVAGAMTPVGFGGIIKTLIENGYIDWIVSTGANIYHEDHFAWGLPVKQGHFEVDDNILYKKQIVRIRDVYVKFFETLEMEDQILQREFENKFFNESFITPEIVHFIGQIDKLKSPFPEKSFLTAAYDFDVPVFISTLKDSSLALNMAVHRLQDKIYKLDLVREILVQSSIIYQSKKNASIELGGGVPKAMIEQAPQLLNKLLNSRRYGLDYVIQMTDTRNENGSYSGAELKNAMTLGAVKPDGKICTVFCDVTIAFPLIALYVLAKQRPKTPKRLYKKINSSYESLSKEFELNIQKN